MLPPGFIQDLLSRVDIVEVVGRHVELKKAGINHKGLCPFHGEKSPSFIVSPSRQTYHCFGCGVHGDAIRFLTEQGGLGFMDAVRELAQQVGMAVPESNASPAQQARAAAERAQRATLGEVLEKAAAHYRGALKAQPRAIDYLKKRGLTGAVAARFGLGYAPPGWRTLAGVFAQYDDPLLVESGLVISRDEEPAADGQAPQEGKRYDRFRDRIMFPIRSVRGEVIGFGGRVLDQGEPKYLNSPETPLFHKGQELYGLYEARQALRQKGFALVVEGYMDVVALAQGGFGNAVATLGTACTADHVAKLFRFTDAVVFSFDGDAAGRRAAARALEAALPHASDTRSIRFLFLPPEHDPDSYIRALGPEAFEQALKQAVPLSAQLVAQAATDCDLATAEGRARMLAQARPLVEQLPADGLLRPQLVAELAQRGGLEAQALQAHWQAQRSAQDAARADREARAARAGAEAGPRGGNPRSGAGRDADAPWAGADDGPPPEDGAHGTSGDEIDHGWGPTRGPASGYAGASGGGSGPGGWGGGRSRGAGANPGWSPPGSWRGSGAGGEGRGRYGDRGAGGNRWGKGKGWGDRDGRDPRDGPPRPPPAAASRLDRAAWLLTRHADHWLALPDALHHLLADQPEPHGRYFGALERLLHDQGPITLDAILAQLQAEDADGSLQAVIARIQRAHALDADPAASDAEAVLRQIERDHLLSQRSLLAETGELSDAMRTEWAAIERRLAQLQPAPATDRT